MNNTYVAINRKVFDMFKEINNSHTHLTLDERRIILTGITNGSTKTAIAQTIGKDKSTIAKEIKLHRTISHKCGFPLECVNYRKCPFGRKCTTDCPEYSPFYCYRRDRSPGACNGCSKWSYCRYNKYTYNPEKAYADYKETLTEARAGVNLTTLEARKIAQTIAPLLKQGLSPYRILQMHPELEISEKTLYNYIEQDVFHDIADVTVMDLRRQVSRKISKKKSAVYKKRADNKYLIGRTYGNYKIYVSENPDCFVTQMDTVYNDETSGPFIQTFKILRASILIGILHKEKSAQAMIDGVNMLENILGSDVFRKYAHVILTDRGSEFSAADKLETSKDGTKRTRIFYCDPMQSGQKGSIENKHTELRYIFPKKTNLSSLGLVNQNVLNLAMSHLNSAPLKILGGKSSLEFTEFLFPDLYEKLLEFGIQKINKDEIILKPYLLKSI